MASNKILRNARLERRYEHLPINVCSWLPNHIPATDTEAETGREREGEQEEGKGERERGS
ncbi:hypothetical protein EYF80_000364 [Liparis tanakae]|uniref:Uncharacterized protein n=1 Tax=Liparis tanakae TaxID=230148 RepID=A0A4Z2JFQ4_9TELE|nr:hypothetical protein EYF80_000364 [Liparis tanakae]